MRFEVRYPTGTVHEVELQGTLAVIGRDPSCDLVLNDAKCSRRHAVVEAGPQGLSIRDSGSANGVYVNGKRVERATLQEGDEVRLGEATLKVLGEEMPGTLVMGPDEMVDMAPPMRATSDSTPTVPPDTKPAPASPPPVAAPPPPIAPPAPAAPPAVAAPSAPAAAPVPAPPPRIPTLPTPALPVASPLAAPRAATPSVPTVTPTPPPPARPVPPPPIAAAPAPARPAMRMPTPEALPRPLPVTVLAGLWLLNAALCVLSGALAVFVGTRSGGGWVASLVMSLLFAGLSLALGLGLLSRAPWARMLQIGVSGFGLLTCVLTPLSAVTLFYMMRPVTQILFSGRASYRALTEEEAELVRKGDNDGMFTGAIVASLLLGVVLAGIATVAIPFVMIKLAS